MIHPKQNVTRPSTLPLGYCIIISNRDQINIPEWLFSPILMGFIELIFLFQINPFHCQDKQRYNILILVFIKVYLADTWCTRLRYTSITDSFLCCFQYCLIYLDLHTNNKLQNLVMFSRSDGHICFLFIHFLFTLMLFFKESVEKSHLS